MFKIIKKLTYSKFLSTPAGHRSFAFLQIHFANFALSANPLFHEFLAVDRLHVVSTAVQVHSESESLIIELLSFCVQMNSGDL